jgi:hypothetical protein
LINRFRSFEGRKKGADEYGRGETQGGAQNGKSEIPDKSRSAAEIQGRAHQNSQNGQEYCRMGANIGLAADAPAVAGNLIHGAAYQGKVFMTR